VALYISPHNVYPVNPVRRILLFFNYKTKLLTELDEFLDELIM
jgi:hypothetical protein